MTLATAISRADMARLHVTMYSLGACDALTERPASGILCPSIQSGSRSRVSHLLGRSAATDSSIRRLFGREREQAVLRDHLDAILDGRGRLVLIGGEVGIGKTTLVDALVGEALGRNTLVLAGHYYDLAPGPPYDGWLELLDGYQPTGDLPRLPMLLTRREAGDALESQAELFVRVRDALDAIAAAIPLVLVLEDLHWADVASLELLCFVARQIAARPLLLLVTYRSDELTRRHPLYQLLPALVREGHAVRLDLKRLGVPVLEALVQERYQLAPADRARLVHYLAEHSEGNPFYFGELLRSLEEEAILAPEHGGWRLGDLSLAPVPVLVRQVTDRRLARLDAQTRRLLELAAVIGVEIPLDLWMAVGDIQDEELAATVEQAAEAFILEELPDGDGLRFTHALIREALHDGVVLPRRRRWHRRIADVLSAQSQPDPNLVAYHYQQARDARTAAWLLRAGERAQALYALHEAIDRYTRALHLDDQLTAAQRQWAYRARGLASELVGDFDAAVGDHEAAHNLARAARDRRAEWQSFLDLGMLWTSRDYGRAGAYYQRALDLARGAEDATMVARSLNRLGNWHMNVDEPELAQRYHQEALAAFRSLDDRRGMAETLDLLGAATSVRGDLVQTAACFDEAVELFRTLGDRQGLSSALATATERAGAIGLAALVPVVALPSCLADAQTALETAREIGWRAGEAYALIELGAALTVHGELGRAAELLHAARQIAREIEHQQWLALAHLYLGNLYLTARSLEQAREYCERGLALTRPVRSMLIERLGASILALVLIRQGELVQARTLLDTVADADVHADAARLTSILAWTTRAELALAQRDPGSALRIIEALVACVPNATPDCIPTWPAILRAEALVALGYADQAEAGLRAAIRDTTAHGARPLRLRAHLALAGLFRAQHRRETADRELSLASAVAAELAGTLPDAGQRAAFLTAARELFPRAEPVRARRATSHAPGRLSARELDVLRLVAQGLTDSEVAARLFMSRRTVTSHLTSIYNKLGVSTRTAAAHVAAERGLI
jgi:DNA-binding CsgD family transcriptional regulator